MLTYSFKKVFYLFVQILLLNLAETILTEALNPQKLSVKSKDNIFRKKSAYTFVLKVFCRNSHNAIHIKPAITIREV